MPENPDPKIPQGIPSEAKPNTQANIPNSDFIKPKKDEKIVGEKSWTKRIKNVFSRKQRIKPVSEIPVSEETIQQPDLEEPEEIEEENPSGIKIEGPSSVNAGESVTFSATSENEEDTDFTWESNNSLIAIASGNGTSAQISGGKEGIASITATGNVSEASGSKQIKVIDPEKEKERNEKTGQKGKEGSEETESPAEAEEAAAENTGAEAAGAETKEAQEAESLAGEELEAAEKAQATEAAAAKGAVTKGAAAKGAVTASPFLPYLIAIAIILALAAIVVLVLLYLSSLKSAGRTAPQYPDYNNTTDASNAGAVLAASQGDDASLLAKAAGLTTKDAASKIAATSSTDSAASNNLNKIQTNANALTYASPTNKKYVKDKIKEDSELSASLAANGSSQTIIENAKKQIAQTNIDYAKYLSLDKPILQLSPFDLQMIKSGQVDKRIIEALKKLVDFSLAQTGDDKARYGFFKIGKIYKADPYDKQETPLNEDEEYVSPHHFGQAIDITVVGNLKCTTDYWVTSTSSWYPCYVYYQGGGPQNSNLVQNNNYASLTIPLALAGAEQNLGQIDVNNARSFYDTFLELGQQTIREELGIDENNWDSNSIFNPEKILASYLATKTNIPVETISNFLQTKDTKSLDRGLVETQLRLAAGSLTGDNWDQIFANTFKAYTKKTLGLQGTDINNFSSNQELGQALVEKSFMDQTDQNKIFEAIIRSNTYYQNLWQLTNDEITQVTSKKDLNYLENTIGKKFREGFMQTDQENSQTRWLGLPSGNLDNNNYRIAAGRYILAQNLHLDPNQAFNNNDYFFKNAPGSVAAGFDLCAGLATGSNCPAYNMFKDPGNYFKSVGDALNEKKNTELTFGGNWGNVFEDSLKTKKISINDLAKILNDNTKKTKLNSDLNSLIQSSIKDDLEISTELPGIFSENRIQNGDWNFVLPLLGLNKVSREAVLPPNTLEKLFLPNINPTDVMQELAGYQALEALGANPWCFDQSILPDNWFKDPQEFATIAMISWLDNYGIDISSINQKGKLQLNLTSFDQLRAILAGDATSDTVPDSLAAFLGVSTNNLKDIISSSKNNTEAEALLTSAADERLGLDPGTTYRVIKGQLDINDWLKTAWENDTLTALAAEQASQALGLPENTALDLNLFINSLKNNNSIDLSDFLLTLGEEKLGEVINVNPNIIINLFNSSGNFDLQITNLQNLAVERLAKNITQNQDQYNTLIGLYQTYLAGGEVNLTSAISDYLGVPEAAAANFFKNDLTNAFSVLGAAEIANQAKSILGDKAIPYEEVIKIFFGDSSQTIPTDPTALSAYQAEQKQSQQTALTETGFSLADAALISKDANIPIGTAKILATGTNDEKNDILVQYVANKAGIPANLIQNAVLSNFDFSNLDVADFIGSLPGIDQYANKIDQLTTVFNDLQTFSKSGSLTDFSSASASFIEDQTGIPLAAAQQWNNSLSNPADLNSLSFAANQLGITNAIDEATGIPGFSGFAFNAARCIGTSGGDFMSCANAVLQVLGWAGFGKTSCEDPQATAQKQIRITLGEILNTNPTPTKIITYRDQDVYYFAGLNDNGEVSATLNDILTQKYGPLAERGNRGMFTSPTMWDHIHVGY